MSQPSTPVPLSAWLMAVPGVLSLAAGVTLMATDLGNIHPLLAETGSGLALLVSGIALLGSAAFPVVLNRLASRDAAAE